MIDKPEDDTDWSLTTWEGASRETLRRWAKLPLERVIAALEEMQELDEALNGAGNIPENKPRRPRVDAIAEQGRDYVANRTYFSYWGKTQREAVEGHCHLLVFHCLDVAATGQALLACHPRLRCHLASLTGLDETTFSRWMVFFLALHDLGKFADSFQQLAPAAVAQLGRQPRARDYGMRHDTLGYHIWRDIARPLLIEQGVIPDGKRRRGQPGGAGLDQWLRAVTGHHGLPPVAKDILLRDYLDVTPDSAAVRAFVTDLYALLLEGDALPALDTARMKHAAWWLAGFTVLCDWLGSSRPAETFSATSQPLADYWQAMQPWAEERVRQAGLLADAPAAAFGLADCFANADPSEIQATPLQARAAELPLGEGPQLFLLEDVTGAGKTEAALLLAHRLMAAGRATGIYFGLPTMATSNAMYERLRHVYRRLYVSNANPSLVLAHSASRLSDSFMHSLATATAGEYGDDTLSADAHCNAWLADNRKKALLAEVGVGTIDQVLLAILPARHQSLRLLGLLDKVLLVDEVHACDAYMHTLLCELLRAHASAGGSAILLSATLSHAQRQALSDAFTDGLKSPRSALQKTAHDDYPLLTHTHRGDLQEYRVATRDSVRRRVAVETLDTESAVVERIVVATTDGQCVCWIRNTVGDARRALALLRECLTVESLDLFHARFALADRLAIEQRVLARFGPASTPEDRQGQVLVATQVVEQSLDLDFDLLVTDLAPIDLIIQRAGRLQRHRRDREGNRIDGPDLRGDPRLLIHTPPWTDTPAADWLRNAMPGTAAVYKYQDAQLWLGLRLLHEARSFRMPEDARHLIEGVYGEEAAEDRLAGLRETLYDAEGQNLAEAAQAELNRLRLDAGYCQEDANCWWDEAKTPTRLGEPSTTLYLARWQDDRLRPWIDTGEHRWARSTVSLLETYVASEAEQPHIPPDILDAARDSLPAKGRWGVLLPLIEQADGWWRGQARNKKGEMVTLYYHPAQGLKLEKERKRRQEAEEKPWT